MAQALVGLILGILALLAGIIVLIKPHLVARVVGILFILGGIGVLITTVSFIQRYW